MAARCCRSLGRINCVAPERGSQRRVACFGWFRLHLGDSQYHDLFSDVVDTFLCVLVFEILLWESHESSYLRFWLRAFFAGKLHFEDMHNFVLKLYVYNKYMSLYIL